MAPKTPKTLKIISIKETSPGWYLARLTDGTTEILSEDSKIIKEAKKYQKKEGNKNEKT